MKLKGFAVLIITLLGITLFSSCDMEYRSSASAHIIVDDQTGSNPVILRADIIYGQNSVKYRTQTVLAEESIVFTDIPFGSYSVNLYAYNDFDAGSLAGSGSASLTVSDGGDNTAAVTLMPVSDEEYTGTLSAAVSWTDNPSFQADTLTLFINGSAAYEAQVSGKESIEINTDLSCVENADAYFALSSGGLITARSENFTLSIFSSQTTDLGAVTLISEEIKALENFTLSYSGTSLDSIAYSFSVPDEDYTSISVTYFDDVAAYRFDLSKEEIEEAAQDGTYSGLIESLKSDVQYTVTAVINYADGTQSAQISKTISTPVPLTKVTINEIDPDSQPGDEGSFGLTFTPSNATDWGGSWSSSNPDVISVDQNGGYQINSFGQAVITYQANNSNRIAQLTINISLLPPELTVTAAENSIELAWTASKLTDTFELIRTVDGQRDESIMLEGSIRSYSDKDIVSGSSYTYTLLARDTESGLYAYSEESEAVEIPRTGIIISVDEAEKLDVVMSGLDQNQIIGKDDEIPVLVEEIQGVVSYDWYINDDHVGTGTEYMLSGSYNNYDLALDPAVQLLTLVVKTDTGQRYSGCIRFIFDMDKSETEILRGIEKR